MFYTNFCHRGNSVYIREVLDDGTRRIREIKNFAPKLYQVDTSIKDPVARDYRGRPLRQFPVSTIREAKDAIEQYSGVDGIELVGFDRWEYQAIAELYDHTALQDAWRFEDIVVSSLDIETECEGGFPDPMRADEVVYLITSYLSSDKKYHVFSLGKFEPWRDDVVPHVYETERELLLAYVSFMETVQPDIITGWNVVGFDITYLCNRITRILGEDVLKRLSPIRNIYKVSGRNAFGKASESWRIVGVSILDLKDLFEKHARTPSPDLKLDTISQIVLDEQKLKHPSGVPGHLLYRTDYQAAVEYNVRDVELVNRIDEKKQLLRLVCTLAYVAMVNYEDVNFETKVWDQYLYLELRSRGQVPKLSRVASKSSYEGAFVKPTIAGFYEWVVSADVTSEYPNMIMALNISPETLIEGMTGPTGVEKFMSGGADGFGKLNQCSVAPNGACFSHRVQGFIPAVVKRLFQMRSAYKKQMLAKLREAEESTDPAQKKALKDAAARLDILQNSTKILLNSVYGATGSAFFRWYDVRMAEAITLSGQFLIKNAARRINEFVNRISGTSGHDYIITMDTDSCYVDFGRFVKRALPEGTPREKIVDALDVFCRTKLQDVIQGAFSEFSESVNAYDTEFLSMKREAIAYSGIFTAKKRYVLAVADNEGVRYAKPKIKATGLEGVKTAASKQVKDWMTECYRIMLLESEEDLQGFVAKCRAEYKSLPIQAMAKSIGVSEIDKYIEGPDGFAKGTPMHSRAAIVYNRAIERAGITDKYQRAVGGDTVRVIMLKTPNPYREDVIGWPQEYPVELKLEEYADRDGMFEKTFAKHISDMCKVRGWDIVKTNKLDW